MIVRLSSVVIAVCAAAALAFIAAFHLRYGDALLGPWRALLFYGLPAAFALGCLAALRAPAALRVSVSLCLVSTIAAIYAVEIYLGGPRERGPELRQRYAEQSGIVFDPRTMSEVVADRRARGEPVMPVFYPRTLIHLPADAEGGTLYPLSSHANRRIVHCQEEGPWRLYDTDVQGFNNPPGLWGGGPIELALVGDSFAWGVCVPRELSIAGQLRERVPRTVNLGMSANGPLAMLGTLREYLPYMRPKTVLWFFYENDLTDLEAERDTSLLMAYLDPAFSQHLFERRPEIEAFLDDYMAERLATLAEDGAEDGAAVDGRSLLGVLTLARLRLTLAGLMGRIVFDWPLYERVLARARDTVHAWGGELVFVYLPSPDRLLGVPDLTNYRQTIKARLFDIALELGVPVIDTDPALSGHDDPHRLARYVGAHYSAEGYAVVARAILDGLAAAGRLRAP